MDYKLLLILAAVVLVAGLISEQHHTHTPDPMVHVVKTVTQAHVKAHMMQHVPIANPFAKTNGQHCRTNSQCKSQKCNTWHCSS